MINIFSPSNGHDTYGALTVRNTYTCKRYSAIITWSKFGPDNGCASIRRQAIIWTNDWKILHYYEVMTSTHFALLALCVGLHQLMVDSPHKWSVTQDQASIRRSHYLQWLKNIALLWSHDIYALCITGPLCGTPPVNGGFPTQMISNSRLWWLLSY